MARQTLLDMTQEILSALSSDEVNSIGDTTESMQVATIIRRKYEDIVSRANIPEHSQTFQLNPSNDVDKPVLMYIPDEVSRIEWIKYYDSNVLNGATPGYKYVILLPISQFLDMINTYDTDESNVDVFVFEDDSSGFPHSFNFPYFNDRQPSYCTILSNKYVIFDSFDNTQDSTLQESKILAYGQVAPVFRMEDDFTPELSSKEFSLLVNEAKALAFYELKQMPHAKAEQEIKRQWSSVQKDKSVMENPSSFDSLPDFGRRGSRYGATRWWNGPKL